MTLLTTARDIAARAGLPAFAIGLVTMGCANHRNWDMSLNYQTVAVPAPPVVLPVQVCAGDTHGASVNVAQRTLANRLWPTALWKALHLPGETRQDKRATTYWLCDFASYDRDARKASSFILNAIQRDEVAKLFAAHPAARTLVVPYFTNLMASDEMKTTLRDARSGEALLVANTGTTQYTDTGAVVFGVFVLTPTEVAYLAKAVCGPHDGDQCQGILVDPNYTNAEAAVTARLRWFPWRLLGLSTSPTLDPVGEVDASVIADPETAHSMVALPADVVPPGPGMRKPVRAARAPHPTR